MINEVRKALNKISESFREGDKVIYNDPELYQSRGGKQMEIVKRIKKC